MVNVVAWQNDFETFASKGPVNVPGAQRKAARAFRAIRDRLTVDERAAIAIARDHARSGEGREEFDGVIEKVRMRLTSVS